jgi:hypothetical protein
VPCVRSRLQRALARDDGSGSTIAQGTVDGQSGARTRLARTGNGRSAFLFGRQLYLHNHEQQRAPHGAATVVGAVAVVVKVVVVVVAADLHALAVVRVSTSAGVVARPAWQRRALGAAVLGRWRQAWPSLPQAPKRANQRRRDCSGPRNSSCRLRVV